MSVAYRLTMPTPFAMTTNAKTVLNAIAPAGHGLVLVEWSISFDGVTASAVPAVVEICTSTQATAGTSGVAPTITLVRGKATIGSAPTGGSNYTAEPTALVSIDKLYLPTYMGVLHIQKPLGREYETDASGGTIKAICIRINVPANVNCLANMEVEALG